MRPLSRYAGLALALCFAVASVEAQGRGRGGSRGGGQRSGGAHARQGGSPGGQWSQRTHSGRQSPAAGHSGAGARGSGGSNRSRSSEGSGSHEPTAGAAAANRRSPNASSGQDAAAGAAAANRKSPNSSGADAAGAAAANRNQPTGAQGAAAGAAAANRNSPQYSGAQGAAAGAAAANRNQPNLSGAAGASAGYASVRDSFHNPDMYGDRWYGDHTGAWAATGWAAGTAWQPTPWAAVASHCGYAEAAPISYDYGVNVVSQDGNVLVNGQSAGTNEQYSQQAANLASTGTAAPAADTDQWLPLGVFGMVRDEHQHAHLIVQLAINQQGVLRGNYTDELTDHTLPLHGAVDKATQRAAWTVGGNTSTVMEAGLHDLTQSEAPALIHKNGQTDHWILVRLDQPAPAADAGSPASTP